MANKVTFTMNNVPVGLDSMYVRVEEDALTAGVRNVLHSGVQAVTGNTIDIDIGENGTVGNGAIVSADNYTSGGAAFKSMTGYALIEAGDISPLMSGITEAWIFGASIEVSLGSGQWSSSITKYMKDEHNLDVQFLTKAWGGQWVHAIEDKWDLEKDAVTGRDDLIVITMPIGNNISNTRTWEDNMTQQDRDDLNAAYLQFMNNITDNGNIVAPVNTTFRNYDFNSVNNEAAGSLPYNENVIYPYAETTTPPMSLNGRPIFDPYNLTRNWYSFTFMDGDEIHLNNLGSQLMRTYYVNVLAALMKGQTPPVVARTEDPVNSMVFSEFSGKCGLAYGYSDNTPMYAPFGFTTRGNNNLEDLHLYHINGHELLSLKVSVISGLSATTACVLPYPNSGEDEFGLVNDELKPKAIYVNSSEWVMMEEFTGLSPNQSVAVEILALSTAGTNLNYSADVSFNAGLTTEATINSKWDGIKTTNEHITRLETSADNQGRLGLYFKKSAGSLGCYLNAMTIEAL